ncbi:small integral membrane protein 4 [Cricetulus griseus]
MAMAESNSSLGSARTPLRGLGHVLQGPDDVYRRKASERQYQRRLEDTSETHLHKIKACFSDTLCWISTIREPGLALGSSSTNALGRSQQEECSGF